MGAALELSTTFAHIRAQHDIRAHDIRARGAGSKRELHRLRDDGALSRHVEAQAGAGGPWRSLLFRELLQRLRGGVADEIPV